MAQRSLSEGSMTLISGLPPATDQQLHFVPVIEPFENAVATYPLTSNQEGIWMDYTANTQSTQYNLTLAWNLHKYSNSTSFGVQQLINVIYTLTAKHAILRSTIVLLDRIPHVQECSQEHAVPQIHVIGSSHSKLKTSAVHKALRLPFDLLKEFPVRWYIVQQSSGVQLYLVAHHICIDGSSMSLLSEELLALYKGDQGSTIGPVMPFSYAGIVERAWRHSGAYHNAEATMLAQIRNTYPYQWNTNPIKGTVEYRCLSNWAVFSTEDLQSWSSRYATSWFRVAATLVGILLHLKSKVQCGEDHSIALAFGGRPKELQSTIGHFAKPLPVKVPIWDHLLADRKQSTLASLIASVGRNISSSKKAEQISLADLARSSRANGVEFHAPKVAMSYSPKLCDDAFQLFPVEGSWDLFFVFLDVPEGVELGVIYDPYIFTHTSIDDFKETFISLVDRSKEQNPIYLDQLFNMPSYTSLPATTEPDQFLPVHGMFRLHAESDPNRIALSCAETGEQMTYGELDLGARVRAQMFASKGIEAGSVLVLHLQPGFQVVEWILAVLYAGCAFVYLDPKLPKNRKNTILDAVTGKALITNDCVASEEFLGNSFDRSMIFHAQADEIPSTEADTVPKRVDPADLAYIIYTSGSTGEPKGVMIEHGSFAHFVRSGAPLWRVGHGSRVFQLASNTFDASILEWSLGLTTGATLCFSVTPEALVGDYLADVIDQNEISFMNITPTALATVPAHRTLPSLRTLSIGGEAVPAYLLELWRTRVNVFNSYGPSEACIVVASKNYPNNGEAIGAVVAGRPFIGAEIYICDTAFMRVLPPGQAGEICISGHGLARGYRGSHDLTEAKFVWHPELNVRMYRTGDRGMLSSDGSLIVLGRVDREVKIRGFRIAIEEVENAILNANEGVTAVSVQRSNDQLSLIGVITPETCDVNVLREKLKNTLPSYMVPSSIVTLPSLPYKISGKLDHGAISKDIRNYLDGKHKSREAPKILEDLSKNHDIGKKRGLRSLDYFESAIAQIWQDELGLRKPPGKDVNFFDIGGHSIMVPRLQKKILHRFPGSNIRVVDLFHQSTIVRQAKLVQSKSGGAIETEIDCLEYGNEVTESSFKKTPTRTLQAIGEGLNKDRQDIAIVGIAGRFPGADNPDELFANLMRGDVCIRSSESSISPPELPDGCVWMPRAGTLSNLEAFDHEFWKLSRKEATDMDPQQRLFLTVALEALEDADIDTFQDVKNNIGIFVGAAANKYHTVTEPVYGDAFQRANRGFVAPCISARTAYHLNLHGPNVTINTNCASGTVALSLATDALKNGRCDTAIVGGVSVQLFDGGYVTQPGQIFSVSGQCRPFDELSDGTVPSDAVVAVVLRKAHDMYRHRKTAYATIAGVAYNSDGATQKAGYQVPSPRGQANALVSAWRNAGVSPDELDYVELHGSGTPIGDALELEGLKSGLEELGYSGKGCVAGSNKGNLGNTQQASGLVSLIKMCKSIQNGAIPPTAGLSELNKLISKDRPFEFAREILPLRSQVLIGISAAGWGGVNTHTVIRAPPSDSTRKSESKVSKYQLRSEVLAAPRIRKKCIEATPNADALEFVVSEIKKILGKDIETDMDLRAAGLDSTAFIKLVHNILQAGDGAYLPTSAIMESLLTPKTLAQKLKGQWPQVDSHRSNGPRAEDDRTASPLCSLKAGSKEASKAVVLLPPSGGTCATLSALVASIPQEVTTLGLEHPRHVSNLAQVSYSISDLAKLFADHIVSHATWRLHDQIILIGASFGGIVATEMSKHLLADQTSSTKNIKLVLLDPPAVEADSSSPSSSDGSKTVPTPGPDFEEVNHDDADTRGNEIKSAEPLNQRQDLESSLTVANMINSANIRALNDFCMPVLGPDVEALYVCATADGKDDIEKKRAWWQTVLPKLEWAAIDCTHEELWKRYAAEVVAMLEL